MCFDGVVITGAMRIASRPFAVNLGTSRNKRDMTVTIQREDATSLEAYREKTERLGGAVVVIDKDGIVAVGGRPEYAMLWDLRVAPVARRQRIGSALLSAVEVVAREAGYRGLQVETQHINVAACRLYAAHRFAVTAVNPGAYREAPAEVQIVWTKAF